MRVTLTVEVTYDESEFNTASAAKEEARSRLVAIIDKADEEGWWDNGGPLILEHREVDITSDGENL